MLKCALCGRRFTLFVYVTRSRRPSGLQNRNASGKSSAAHQSVRGVFCSVACEIENIEQRQKGPTPPGSFWVRGSVTQLGAG